MDHTANKNDCFLLIFFYENITFFSIICGICNKKKIFVLSYYYLVLELRKIDC